LLGREHFRPPTYITEDISLIELKIYEAQNRYVATERQWKVHGDTVVKRNLAVASHMTKQTGNQNRRHCSVLK
jgi:hypothetical protein